MFVVYKNTIILLLFFFCKHDFPKNIWHSQSHCVKTPVTTTTCVETKHFDTNKKKMCVWVSDYHERVCVACTCIENNNKKNVAEGRFRLNSIATSRDIPPIRLTMFASSNIYDVTWYKVNENCMN